MSRELNDIHDNHSANAALGLGQAVLQNQIHKNYLHNSHEFVALCYVCNFDDLCTL